MTFGQRIKIYRQLAKKTQKDIEGETEIPQTTLSGWENDKTEPTISDAIKLAVALKITLMQLFEDPEELAATLQKTG